jgi:hypothetical protein
MNVNELRSILKDLTEEKAPTADIDLWPSIQTQIQMGPSTESKGTIMNSPSNSQHRLSKPVLIGMAVVLIAVAFFALPQGQAMGEQILHFFVQGESSLMPGLTKTPVRWVEQTSGSAAPTFTPMPTQVGPAFAAKCGGPRLNDAHCSIEEIRKLVSFPVFALAKLPEGMQFTGATGRVDQVFLVYTLADPPSILTLQEEPYTGAAQQLNWEVGAGADIRSVPVGAVEAEYVKGAYDGASNPPAWNPSMDTQSLRWVDRGTAFLIRLSGASQRFNRDDMAALALKLTDGPVGENGKPAMVTATPAGEAFDPHKLYPLTLVEVKQKAGFAILSPSRLPDILTFVGTNFDEQTDRVGLDFISYNPNYPEATDGVVIFEELAPEGSDCDLCGFIQGDGLLVEQYPLGKLVSKDVKIETVKIGQVSGEYVEGIGWSSRTEIGGWKWDSTPYGKRLRFRVSGLAIEISSWTFNLTKADLIAIAESLK